MNAERKTSLSEPTSRAKHLNASDLMVTNSMHGSLKAAPLAQAVSDAPKAGADSLSPVGLRHLISKSTHAPNTGG